MVNHRRLFKTLADIGVPPSLVHIIQKWLTNRSFYVEINGTCSTLNNTTCGTVQGSILGPILFALFISPLFDIIDLISYADDNYIIASDMTLEKATTKVKMKAEKAITWLREAGMKVNESKTEFCVFYYKDCQVTEIKLMDTTIKSTKTITVLGVFFDSKLDWKFHINYVVNSCQKTLYALRKIRKYFNDEEFLNVVNAMFYSKMYYACQVWLIPTIKPEYKQKLLSLSSKALRLVSLNDYDLFSFEELHILFSRATPIKWSNYMCANQMYSIVNNHVPELICHNIQLNIQINNRTDGFVVAKTNVRKIGVNCFSNRLTQIEMNLKFSDFGMSKNSFKVKCKQIFL